MLSEVSQGDAGSQLDNDTSMVQMDGGDDAYDVHSQNEAYCIEAFW